MNNFLYLDYPSWIHPEIIPGVGFLRWYGLMYVFAFGVAYLVLYKQFKGGALDSPDRKATSDEILSFISTGFIFLLIGARIFACLVYTPSGKYLKEPWLMFWPFENINGKLVFTGLSGMSYHGGVIGGVVGMIVWCALHKRPFFKWCDTMVVAIPAGYAFGRLGNFLNGELYGRLTTVPWGMVFPAAPRYSASQPWVKEFCDSIGMAIPKNGIVNLPRHPSQLYEMLFEGIILFVILWFLRRKKPFDGFLSSIYLIGYGVFRFVIEYFRMPDEDMGFRVGDKMADINNNASLLNLSMGQILCFIMIVCGIGLMLFCYFYSKKHPERDSVKSSNKTKIVKNKQKNKK